MELLQRKQEWPAAVTFLRANPPSSTEVFGHGEAIYASPVEEFKPSGRSRCQCRWRNSKSIFRWRWRRDGAKSASRERSEEWSANQVLHRSWTSVDSEKRVDIPRATPPGGSLYCAAHPELIGESHLKKPAILTVDDDPVVLSAIERDLRQQYRADYRVMKAGSAAEGIAPVSHGQSRGVIGAVADLRLFERITETKASPSPEPE